VAVAGSYYVQVEELRGLAFALAVPVGMLAAGILMINNIRDLETDRRAGKRTLAVRLGRTRARRLYAAVTYAAFVWTAIVSIVSGKPALQLMWLSAVLAPSLVRTVATRTDGPSLNGALAQAGRLLALFSILVSVGLLLS
jgi:1,4-dihydroxy-2-naphthoate octaprenyltransferase